MVKRESHIINKLILEEQSQGNTLFRNSTGAVLHEGRWLSYGLCKGGSDLIGFTPIEITQDMVGKTIAQFTAIELKINKDRLSPEQKSFMETVKKNGGRAEVIYS